MNDRLIAVALGNDPADLILKNGRVIDVLTGTIYPADVAVADGRVAGVGAYRKAEQIIDLGGKYLSPGFINAHCHVESSMASPAAYCAEELKWGVTTLITDPHEIANVAGEAGIRYMLDASQSLPINYYVQLPSCVPSTGFEHAGCVLSADRLAPLACLPGVLGLGEMMNVPGVLMRDGDVLDKLRLFDSRIIDGHAPCVSGPSLQAYAAAGIATDHESITWEEAREKLRAGLAILVREGSASKNLEAILTGALAEQIDLTQLAFCTDDKHLADIRREGTIRWCVKRAVSLGMEPIRAFQMATVHAARIYGLHKIGAIAPGWQADFVVFDDLESLTPVAVYHRGQDALRSMQRVVPLTPPEALRSSVRIAPVSEADFDFAPDPDKAYPVIEILPGEIATDRGTIPGCQIENALARGEICKIAVLERHHATGHVGLGLLRGYGLRDGAVATTVAHDSHNLIVVGTNTSDMLAAVQEIRRVQGGYTIVRGNTVIATLPLSICGLMSPEKPASLIPKLDEICNLAHRLGVSSDIDPFITLSFMALPVIPKMRITDMGMFDSELFRFCT